MPLYLACTSYACIFGDDRKRLGADGHAPARPPLVYIDAGHIGHGQVAKVKRVCGSYGVPCKMLNAVVKATMKAEGRKRRDRIFGAEA